MTPSTRKFVKPGENAKQRPNEEVLCRVRYQCVPQVAHSGDSSRNVTDYPTKLIRTEFAYPWPCQVRGPWPTWHLPLGTIPCNPCNLCDVRKTVFWCAGTIEKYLPNFVKPTQKICTFAASKKVGRSLIFHLILNLEYQIIKIINKQNNNTKMKREFTKYNRKNELYTFLK